MAGIFDYLEWRGDLTFEQSAFNETDSLIICALSYFPFELTGTPKNISVKDAINTLISAPNLKKNIHLKADIPLMKVLPDTARFGAVEILDFVNFVDDATQTQFSAITVKIADDLSCVAFRGTDNNLVGWKEDFNMGFVCPVPAQKLAVEYLERISHEIRGKFIVGGHSKGGNLAIYAAAFCHRDLQHRIESVYNYDGPGFDDTVLSTDGYKNICPITKTFVPQSSIVGMLLGHEEKYTIVRSKANGIMQHDFYSWEVKQNHFICLDTVTDSSKFIDSSLKAWIAQLDYEKREQLIDTVYTIIAENNFKTVHDLNENWLKSAGAILKSVHNLDDETRRAVTQTLLSLMKCAGQNLTQIQIKKKK